MSRLFVIGLTGPTGAGKSTVAQALRERGIPVLDCDIAAREVTEKGSPVLQELADAFGQDILLPDGTLDRRRLGSRAFADKDQTKLLNRITHPAILKVIKNRLAEFAQAGNTIAVLDAPTLFEAGADALCDFTVCVIAGEEIRLHRIMERDEISEEQVRLRMSAQKPEEYYVRKCNFSIVNVDETLTARKINLLLKKVEEARNGL